MGRASLGRGWEGCQGSAASPTPGSLRSDAGKERGGGGTHTDSIPPAGPLRPRRASLRAPPCRTGWGLGGELPKPRGDFGVLGGGTLNPAVPVSCVSPGCRGGMLGGGIALCLRLPPPQSLSWGGSGVPPTLSSLLFPSSPWALLPPGQREKRADPAPPPRLGSQYHQCSQFQVGWGGKRELC